MTMSFEQANVNLLRMYNNSDAIFVAGKNNKLETISSWNLLGRLIHHIKDKMHNGADTAKAKKLISDSLTVASAGMSPKRCFFQPEKYFFQTYTKNHSYNEVVDRVAQIKVIRANSELSNKVQDLGRKCDQARDRLKKLGLEDLVFKEYLEISDLDNPNEIERTFQEAEEKQKKPS